VKKRPKPGKTSLPKRKQGSRKRKIRPVKLLAPISILTLAAIIVILPQSRGIDKPQAYPVGFHTEPVPAEPLVEILPVGEVAQTDLELVAQSIALAFKVRTNIVNGMALPEAAWNEARKQHNADWILRVTGALRSEGAFRTILVMAADIYSGGLPFVISMVSPDRKMILISTARLEGSEGVELPLEQVRSRISRLAVRLFVASLNMRGCSNDCVLAGKSILENLDKVPGYFCPECASLLELTLQTGIGSPYSYLMEALFHSQAGELDEAIEKLRRAINLKSDYLAAYLNLAELYVEKGWHAEAITVLRKASRAVPGSIEPRKKLVWVLLQINQPSTALEELHGALALAPDSRELHRMLGIVYQFYFSDPERATYHYQRFLELDGDPALIEDLLSFPEEKPPEEKDK
jgi:predicted Zn-dependent protease